MKQTKKRLNSKFCTQIYIHQISFWCSNTLISSNHIHNRDHKNNTNEEKTRAKYSIVYICAPDCKIQCSSAGWFCMYNVHVYRNLFSFVCVCHFVVVVVALLLVIDVVLFSILIMHARRKNTHDHFNRKRVPFIVQCVHSYIVCEILFFQWKNNINNRPSFKTEQQAQCDSIGTVISK